MIPYLTIRDWLRKLGVCDHCARDIAMAAMDGKRAEFGLACKHYRDRVRCIGLARQRWSERPHKPVDQSAAAR